jgi:hypothetical protein
MASWVADGLLPDACYSVLRNDKPKEERRKKKEKGRKDFSDFERRTTH